VKLVAPHGRPQIYFPSLSRKIAPNDTIYMKNSFGVGGVQNRQSPVAIAGCRSWLPSSVETGAMTKAPRPRGFLSQWRGQRVNRL